VKSEITLEEANAWHLRNLNRSPTSEIIEAVRRIKDNWLDGGNVGSVLEVGCSDGRNGPPIKNLAADYFGIDPSPIAIEEGLSNGLSLTTGWADTFQLDQKFDVVILGFFLYLTSPTSWFKIAQNIFDHLKPNSFIIIHDFYSDKLIEKAYFHEPAMHLYKFDFNKLFTWHPSIKVIYQDILSENLNDRNDRDCWYRTTILKVTK